MYLYFREIMKKRKVNGMDKIDEISLCVMGMFWLVSLIWAIRQGEARIAVLLTAVILLAGWLGIPCFIKKGMRRGILLCLLAAAAALAFCTAAEWKFLLLAAGAMVFVSLVWEFVPRYHHGRRYDTKDRRETVPLWEDLCAFACIGGITMGAMLLL